MAKGITNETRSASQKKFKPNPRANEGLCIGALVDVNVTTADIAADSPMTTFQGKKIPRLNFVYESRGDKPGVRKSFYIHFYLAIEHTPDSIIAGKDGGAWRWDQLSQMVKHQLEVFREYVPFTDEEVAKLALDFVDEEDGVFVEQEADVVIAAYTKFFNNIVSLFKPADKAIYQDDKGVCKVIWLKLLLDIKGRPVNGGEYGFSGFPGEGVIELYRKDVKPSLTIKLPKGENIIPMAATPKNAPVSNATTGSMPTESAEEVPDFLGGGAQ